MARPDDKIVFTGVRGRNGADPPFELEEHEVVEALNVDFFDGSIGRKRGGASNVTLTFSAGGPFTGVISSAHRHVPGSDETAAELWLTDDAATPIVGRMAGAATFTAPTLKDNIQANPADVYSASFNGKLFFTYNSAQDRLHVWDGSTVRRVGVATSAAATVADTGAGAYAATIRYYKVSYAELSGSTVVRRAELSAVVSFTPSGSGTAARVTKPAAISEGETHWELWGSADNVSFYLLAQTAVGTTTYDDSATPSTYSSGTAAPTSGTNTVPVSWKYLFVDEDRLLGYGSWESGQKQNRIWFTPVIGDNDIGDDERVVYTTTQKNWIDLDEKDGTGSAPTGFGGPIGGAVVAFKYRQVWKLTRTSNVLSPYTKFNLSKVIGCIHQKTVVMAEDEQGNPALYWLSHKGPYRLGQGGMQYCGRNIEDRWASVNLAASSLVAHGIYHSDKHQIWWWIAMGANNDPSEKLVYDCSLGRFVDDGRRVGVHGGWSRHDGNSAAARCSVMMSNTLGATMSRDLKPYIGRSSGTALWKTDTGTTDAGTNYQAYVKSKPFAPHGLGRNFRLASESLLLAEVSSGVTITQTLDRDLGAETRTSTALLTAGGTESRTLAKFEAADFSDLWALQCQVGDGSAADTSFVLDAVVIPLAPENAR